MTPRRPLICRAPWEWRPVRLAVGGAVWVRIRWGSACERCAWRGPWRDWFSYPGADARCHATDRTVDDFTPELRCPRCMPGRVAP